MRSPRRVHAGVAAPADDALGRAFRPVHPGASEGEPMSVRRFVGALAATILATGLTVAGVTTPASGAVQLVGAAHSQRLTAATSVPRFDHVVLVMFENHANTQITGSTAPYFTSLASQ